jgi:hypothetical protein
VTHLFAEPGHGEGPPRPGRAKHIAGLLALAAATPLVAGCSDPGGEPHTARAERQAEAAVSPSTTAPPATDEASHDEVVALVDEATSLADGFWRDPSVIDDPNNAELARYRELYTADSPTPPAVEAGLRTMVERGERYQPAANGFMREVEIYQWGPATDDDTLRFDTCSLIDRELVGSDGAVVSADARLLFVGGEAHRVEGVWRFYGLSNDMSRTVPLTPGAARPGMCESFVAAAGQPGLPPGEGPPA